VDELFSRDPDGDLSLDWFVGDDALSISVNKDGRMAIGWSVKGKSGSCTCRTSPEVSAVLEACYAKAQSNADS
jgi:hypothetical protein